MSFVASSIKQKLHRSVHSLMIEVTGIAQFNGTDASGDVDCMISTLEGIEFAFIGAPATDETPYLNETVVDGTIPRPADGKLTIGRTGTSPTSGLWVSFRYWGF